MQRDYFSIARNDGIEGVVVGRTITDGPTARVGKARMMQKNIRG